MNRIDPPIFYATLGSGPIQSNGRRIEDDRHGCQRRRSVEEEAEERKREDGC